MPEITSAAIIDALLAIVGAKGVLHGEDDTAGFLSDWHNRYHGEAYAVVLPETTDQVAAIMAYADKNNIIVVPQGGNTGFMGGATPDDTGHSIVLSLKRMNKIREIELYSNVWLSHLGSKSCMLIFVFTEWLIEI